MLASAGRDINLVASVVKNSGAHSDRGGQTTLVAQNDINLTTLQTRQTNNLERDAGNFRRATSTAESGSSIEGAGNVTLSAGNDVNARAARVEAGKTLDVAAANNIILQAGQATTNVDQMASASGKDLFFSSSIQTRRQEQSATAQVSSFTGQSTQVVADNTLASIGAQLEATGVDTGTGTLRVEGKNNTLLYEVQDFKQVSVTTQTKTSLGFMFDPLGIGPDLENKTVTDARATSTAIGTKLVSTQKIEIGVGNKTELRGAEVEAPQIAFVQTDPSKAGELILGGSTNTTQTSHTEKTETAGVYQEMKGNGSTVETLNQTTLKGNVSFDAALKITVQIPDTKGGQALKSQINALVEQGNGVGLDYLNALANDPNVKWDQVALAHEKWSYDQGGLTGAGAALLTIVVTYFTAGMGTTALGTTTAAAGGAAGATVTTLGGVTLASTAAGLTTAGIAVNAGFAALASQAAVAMVNNKGDIGKTLEQLGSEESIKGLLTTMLTAGALDKLNASYFKGVDATSKFGTQLLKNVTNNLASSAMDAALNGKAFNEDAISKALSSALVTTGMAQGANAIGDAASTRIDANGNIIPAQIDAFTQKLAHAVLGCAGGAAIAGNGSGCAPGAVGAVVGELTAEYAKKNGLTDTEAAGLAKILAATSGVIVGGGGDNAAAVNIAATAGANAAENNYLNHRQWDDLAKELAGAQTDAKRKEITDRYVMLSKAQDALLATCDARGDCATLSREVFEGTAERLQLIKTKQLPDYFAGGSDLQFMGQKLATNTSFRQQVGQSVNYMAWCSTNTSACNQDQMKKAMALAAPVIVPLIGGSAGALAINALVNSGRMLASEAALVYQLGGPVGYCSMKPDSCMMIVETAAGIATNTNAPSVFPVNVAGKTLSKVEQEIAAARANGANGVASDISSTSLGDFLGKGGNKNVYAYGDGQAVAVLQPGKPAQAIADEIGMLNQLNDLGIPTVNARSVTVNGQPAMIMDQFAQGSKDIVALQNGKVRIVGDSPLLNAQSVSDLQNIRNTMVNNNVQINDLQFLIGNDGRIVVADPLKVNINTPPSNNNLRMIDLLIQAAKKNGPF